jgi:catechol 2,3-dioxygenase-like lactoylglutathione lyase family enzyme
MTDAFLSSLVFRTVRLDACAQFYRELGLALCEERHGEGPLHYSYQSGEVLIEFYPAKSPDDLIGAGIMIGVSVKSLDEALARLQSIGVGIVKAPENTEWGRRAVVLDPDGRKVEIYEREKSQGDEKREA